MYRKQRRSQMRNTFCKNIYNQITKHHKRKKLEDLSESEKIAAQLKLLESENRRLKMENDFLKKLDEIERR